MKIAYNEEEQWWECPKCDRVALSKGGMVTHLKAIHDVEVENDVHQ